MGLRGVGGGRDSLFVDAVAAEVVQLGAQQVARGGSGIRRRVELLAAESDCELARRLDRPDRPVEARVQPAGEQRCLGARPPDPDLLLADLRPAAGELDPPGSRPRPGDVARRILRRRFSFRPRPRRTARSKRTQPRRNSIVSPRRRNRRRLVGRPILAAAAFQAAVVDGLKQRSVHGAVFILTSDA